MAGCPTPWLLYMMTFAMWLCLFIASIYGFRTGSKCDYVKDHKTYKNFQWFFGACIVIVLAVMGYTLMKVFAPKKFDAYNKAFAARRKAAYMSAKAAPGRMYRSVKGAPGRMKRQMKQRYSNYRQRQSNAMNKKAVNRLIAKGYQVSV